MNMSPGFEHTSDPQKYLKTTKMCTIDETHTLTSDNDISTAKNNVGIPYTPIHGGLE